MKFSTRQDIDAPIGFVFEALSDFEARERAALRHGIEVTRADDLTAPAPGLAWRATFALRGKPQLLEMRLQDYVPPERMLFLAETKALFGSLSLDLMNLSPQLTRVIVGLELKPRTIAARVMLQSVRLAKHRAQARLERRVQSDAQEIESRFKRGAA